MRYIGIGLLIAAFAAVLTSCGSFGFRRAEAVTNEYVFETIIKDFDIETTACDVLIMPWDDRNTKVVCHEADLLLHDVQVKDGKLVIKRKERTDGVSFNNMILRIEIMMPAGSYGNVMAKTSSGSIELSSGFDFVDAILSASSGAIVCDAQVRGQLLCNTSSGGQRLSGTVCKWLQAASSSGSILAQNIRAEVAEFSASSGSVTLNDVIAQDELSVETSSGDISFENCDARSVKLRASSGEISGSLLTGKVFRTKASSGSVRVPQDDPSGGRCEVTTSSGDINITVK